MSNLLVNKRPLGYLFLGFLSLLFYFASSMGMFPFRITYYLFTLVGWLMSLSISGIFLSIHKDKKTTSFTLGSLFIFIAGVLFSIMATMQASNIYWKRDHPDFDRLSFQAVFSSQLGVDFSFDLFISTGIFFLGLFVFRLSGIYSRILGIIGMTIGITGLTFNMLAFPENPGIAGLIDPGPFFGMWFALFLLIIGSKSMYR